MSPPFADGSGPAPDTWQEYAFLGVVALVLLVSLAGAFSYYTALDAEIRFLTQNPAQYFSVTATDSEPSELSSIEFRQEDIQFLNRVAGRSLGNAVADERLFCFGLNGQRVIQLRLVDRVEESSRTSISGSCLSTFSVDTVVGFLHTHPDHSDELSAEDKRIESPRIQMTCLQYDEISVNALGNVGGIKCWNISRDAGQTVFERVPTRIM